MGRRYSDIKRGAQLQNDLTNYISYLTTPRTPKVNTQGNRPVSSAAFVNPYGQDLATDEVVPVRVATESYTRLSTLVNGGGSQSKVTNEIGTDTPQNVAGFRPAQLVTFENATKTKSVATSEITKRQYLKYAGDRYSCPFGRKVATDNLEDAFQILAAAARARTGLAVNRVSLVVERFSH